MDTNKTSKPEESSDEIVFEEIDTTNAPVFARLSYEEDFER